MKYLITGSAGFIGFHLAKELLKDKKNKIYGLDNFDNYYSTKLKKKRISVLKKESNFKFIKLDLSNIKEIKKLYRIDVDILFHLAAQAGVRYTLINPSKYIKSNIVGYYNLLNYIKKSKVKYIFYASSSSIYGDNKDYPVDEKMEAKPKNIYAFSKVSNENCSKLFSNIFSKKFIGLRFFTVYGEWGRPDMLIYKYLNFARKKKIFYVNNFGNDYRDFTYVGDVISMLKLLVKKRKKLKDHDIFNICSNKPVKTKKIIQFLLKAFPGKVRYVGANKIEMLKTHGNNKKILAFTKFKRISNFEEKFFACLNWFKNNKNLFN